MALNLLIGPLVAVRKHPGGFVEDGNVDWPEGDRHRFPPTASAGLVTT